MCCNLLWSTSSNYHTAITTAFWSHVYDIVGKTNDIKVVLNDDDGIALVNKFTDDPHKDADILKMKSSGRLIKYI